MIEVSLRRIGEGGAEGGGQSRQSGNQEGGATGRQDGIEARITLPDGLEGAFEWGGERVALQPGSQTLEIYRE
jgi:hypothetical protein